MEYRDVFCCHHCHKIEESALRCIRCKAVSYCSSDCQTNDWSIHKTKCSPFEEGKELPKISYHARMGWLPEKFDMSERDKAVANLACTSTACSSYSFLSHTILTLPNCTDKKCAIIRGFLYYPNTYIKMKACLKLGAWLFTLEYSNLAPSHVFYIGAFVGGDHYTFNEIIFEKDKVINQEMELFRWIHMNVIPILFPDQPSVDLSNNCEVLSKPLNEPYVFTYYNKK